MSNKWKSWFGVLLSLGVALMPFLGFPRGLKDIFYTLAGIVLAAVFFMLSYDKADSD
ncbi:MAG: hypothetical protein Q7S19_01435 [bacterium]|nr:hypothetical protein [bacterium]